MYNDPMVEYGPGHYYPIPDQCYYIRYLLTRLRGQAIGIQVAGTQEPYRNLTVQMVANGVVYASDEGGEDMCVIPVHGISALFIPRQISDELITYPDYPAR
jgi:hypothetical protein